MRAIASTAMIIALVVPALGLYALPKPTIFDVAADFSSTTNPQGVWQYGYSETESLAPDQFRLDTYAEKTGMIGFWHPLTNKGPGPGYYPYVAYNTTKESQFGSQNGWALRAGQIAMEASNTGQYSLVRFVAPTSGVYQIAARFEGIHFHLSTTDVHVLHNAEPLFEAEVEGYGGDSSFHKIEGAHPTASFGQSMQLSLNDIVTFAVGYGRNKTHFNDTTGLSVTITLVSESPV